ncbi:hypothetical protein F4810DRAFT_227581 [Camillea tinctor]|nr:hypothetical protein F4810DRAFT_227581 [Camillea tinctor]
MFLCFVSGLILIIFQISLGLFTVSSLLTLFFFLSVCYFLGRPPFFLFPPSPARETRLRLDQPLLSQPPWLTTRLRRLCNGGRMNGRTIWGEATYILISLFFGVVLFQQAI